VQATYVFVVEALPAADEYFPQRPFLLRHSSRGALHAPIC